MSRMQKASLVVSGILLLIILSMFFVSNSQDGGPPLPETIPPVEARANEVPLGAERIEPRAPDVAKPEVREELTDKKTSSKWSHKGDSRWFYGILHSLKRRVDSLDPSGQKGAGLEFLRSIIESTPDTFKERMTHALAIRLIPYSIRGATELNDKANALLIRVVSSSESPGYSRMAAISAAYGFRLDYNVLPFLSAKTREPDERVEVYVAHEYPENAKRGFDGLRLESGVESLAALREVLRHMAKSQETSRSLLNAVVMALRVNPGNEERAILYDILGSNRLNIIGKEEALESLAMNPGLETAERLRAMAEDARRSGNPRLIMAYNLALAQLGVGGNTLAKRCKEVILGAGKEYSVLDAIDYLNRIHAGSESADARSTLEFLLLDSSVETRVRKYTIESIGKHKNRSLLPFLKTVKSSTTDARFRDELDRAINLLAK